MTPITPSQGALTIVPYDRRFLALSAQWLVDPETQALTMTPAFDRRDQERFFASLPARQDYHIWGLVHAGEPIGAAGIKNVVGRGGEYWGYIGVKRLWGRGLGAAIMALIEDQARSMGLDHLFLRVASNNIRAIRLYRRFGYTEDDGASDVIEMRKVLAA